MLNKDELYRIIYDSKLNGFSCLKQSVYAIIINEKKEIIVGSNNINNKVLECPRVTNNSKTGEDYHFCKEICNQNNHAEVDAIKKGIESNYNFNDAILYLVGHTYCCENCLKEIDKVNIKNIVIIGNSNNVG